MRNRDKHGKWGLNQEFLVDELRYSHVLWYERGKPNNQPFPLKVYYWVYHCDWKMFVYFTTF